MRPNHSRPCLVIWGLLATVRIPLGVYSEPNMLVSIYLSGGASVKAKSIAIVAHGTSKNKAKQLVEGLI